MRTKYAIINLLPLAAICLGLLASCTVKVAPAGSSSYDLAPLEIPAGSHEVESVPDGIEEDAPMSIAHFESYLLPQLKSFALDIDVSAYGFAPEEMGDIFLMFVDDHPELFYVKNEIEWSYFEGGAVDSIQPSYTADMNTMRRQVKLFDNALEYAYEEIMPGETSAETVTAVNDWICLNAVYDETLTRYSPYDLLVDGSGVCEAYTQLFGILMNHFGIQWRKLDSDAMNHTWNQVRIDGEWLHVDVTWNDPVPDAPGRALRDYLMLTDDELSEMPEAHYDWAYWVGN
jgi:transglutaminase-like putative cysteine protease